MFFALQNKRRNQGRSFMYYFACQSPCRRHVENAGCVKYFNAALLVPSVVVRVVREQG